MTLICVLVGLGLLRGHDLVADDGISLEHGGQGLGGNAKFLEIDDVVGAQVVHLTGGSDIGGDDVRTGAGLEKLDDLFGTDGHVARNGQR